MDAAKAFVLDAQGQEDLLKEALRNAQDQAFRMKRSMDSGELNGVLKHAAELLRELRTSLLSPKNYYQLCTSRLRSAAISCALAKQAHACALYALPTAAAVDSRMSCASLC